MEPVRAIFKTFLKALGCVAGRLRGASEQRAPQAKIHRYLPDSKGFHCDWSEYGHGEKYKLDIVEARAGSCWTF